MRYSRVCLPISILLLCCAWAQAQENSGAESEPTADTTNFEALYDLQRAQTLLNGLEENFTQMDPRLSEPLMQVATQMMLLGRFDEAHRYLDRGMQIVRVNDGLYTRAQRPFLQKKIENFAN